MIQIAVSVLIPAPIERVWMAYTSPTDIVHWNFASHDWHTPSAKVDLRVGGAFSSRMEARDGSEGFDFEGIYTQVIEHELLEYRFGDRMASVLFSQSEVGVKVEVVFDSEDENSIDEQRVGWQAILNNFASYVEGLEPEGLE